MFFSSIAHAASTFMPPEASDYARRVDNLYEFLLIASFISCVLVIGGLTYFAIKYRRRSENDKTAYITHNNILEFSWSFIPFLIFMFVFVWGWMLYSQLRTMPKNALEIAVHGQQWNWTFVYKNGRSSSGELYVPINTPVKFVMSSKDVIHSMYIPAFRNKQDVVPGRYTAMWFKPDKIGNFQIFCAEYCGTGHSAMLATMHVVSKEKFEQWMQNNPYKGLSLADIGKKVYASRCVACHNTTSARKVGPGWGGIWGEQTKFQGGGSATVDENYIRESMLKPNAKVVAGYPANVMPSFSGQLNEQEILGVIEFIKTLKK